MSPIIPPAHVSTSHSIKSRPICIPRVQFPILRFFQLSALTSWFFFLKNNKRHFLVFWVFILFFSRTWTRTFTSARRFIHDTMLRFTLSAASAFLFFAPFSFAAAVVVAVSLVFSRTQRNISRCLSRPPPFPLKSFILFVSSSLLFLLFLMCVGESSSTFMRLFLLSSSLFKSSYPLLTTAHSRCDVFLSAIFASVLQLHPQHLGIC